MPWAAAGAIGGALITSSAASGAADSQSDAAKQASQAEQMAALQMREDLKPWTSTGVAANNRLSQYLGLGMAPGTVMSNGMQAGLNRDQLRNQLLSRYTTTTQIPGQQPASVWGPNANQNGMTGLTTTYGNNTDGATTWNTNNRSTFAGNDPRDPEGTGPTSQSNVDEAGLNAEVDKYFADQAAEEAKFASDPNYGSLMRAYRDGAEFDSGPAFSFTGEDLKNDPGYKFGLDQGTTGLERGQAARGNFLSGAAMKELTRFNEDYAGTKFNEGFNRASSTYGTNLARRQNEWNTNQGAYNQNRNTIYNFLTGTSATGQASATRVGANNQQVASNVGNNLMSAGAAQSAAQVAGGNALANGMNRAANSLNSAGTWNNMLAAANFGRSGNNYNGSSTDYSAPNYTNTMDQGYSLG